MTNSEKFISISEAARRANISRTALRKHMKVGRIISDSNGKIEVASFNSWLVSKHDSDVVKTSRPNATTQVLKLLKFDKLQDAELHKRSYEAHLKQLEYDEKSGKVVLIEDVVAALSSQLSAIRTRLLAIPAEMAPQIFNCKTVTETQSKMQQLMVRTLEELSEDERWIQHLQERENSLLESTTESTEA